MDDKHLIKELNKILTLEHGHLGMYRNFLDYDDKEIRRVFRRFMKIEVEHINKLNDIIRNLGVNPSLIVETGDTIGRMFGITINLADIKEVIRGFSFIEQKSYHGYSKFVEELEKDDKERNNFIAEIASSNMLEAKLMYLWLEDKLRTMK